MATAMVRNQVSSVLPWMPTRFTRFSTSMGPEGSSRRQLCMARLAWERIGGRPSRRDNATSGRASGGGRLAAGGSSWCT